jgi:cysteine desulfuration protein SufE
MTTQQIQQEIINEFRGAGDWMEKYGRLMKIGRSLPATDDKHKVEANLVKGCQVRTWYRSSFKDGKMYFEVDSMSQIIKGALVLLLRVMNDQTPETIKNTDLYFIDKTGLTELFSPVKANSLWKVTNQMKADAGRYAK